MALVLDGNGTMTVGNGDITGITAGAIESTAIVGTVRQVVQTVKMDSFSSSAASWTDITGLSLTITPTSSSSKILVSFSLMVGCADSNPDVMLRLVRNSTAIALGDNGGTDNVTKIPISYNTGTQGNYFTADNNLSYIDSPNTTSSTTYKIQMRNWSASQVWYVGRRALNTSFLIPSFITATEIS